MRARNIKPGFFSNDQLAECSALARLLFIGLWCCADREGRLEDRPRKIKGCVFPFEDSVECNIESLLDELAAGGFINRYAVESAKVIEIPTFRHHQRPHRNERPSVLPGREELSTKVRSRKRQGAKHFALNDERGMMNDDMRKDECRTPSEGAPHTDIDLFERFWQAFPGGRKTDKARAVKAWKAAIEKTDPETIIAAAAEYAASPVGKGDYVKQPATWLNGACWNDDRAAWNRADRRSHDLFQRPGVNLNEVF